MRVLVPAIVALLVLTGCSTAPAAEPSPTPTHPAPTVPVATPTPVATSTSSPTHEPTPTPTAAPRSPAETAYLEAVGAALGPGWRDTYEYLGAAGQDQMWLDMGYAVCGMLSAGTSREQTIEFLEPNYVNPRLYQEGFAAVLADAAPPLCSA